MKILVVSPEYLPTHGGGIITFYRDLLPEMVKQGHEVTVLVGSGAFTVMGSRPLYFGGVQVVQLDDKLFRTELRYFDRYQAFPTLRAHLAAAWALYKLAVDVGEFDIVEASDWGLLYLPWVIEGKTPSVVQLHGSAGQIDQRDPVAGEEVQGALMRLMERDGLKLANAPQAYSRQNAKFWSTQTEQAVDVIRPAWRPLNSSGEATSRSQRGLVVGRVQRWKGPHILCDALRILGDVSLEVDWIGRDTIFGNRRKTMSSHLAEQFPDIWGKQLINLPPKTPEEIANCMARAAFTVVPSLWDTFNFTCIESMGTATPTICSNGAGASELINDGVNGFVFKAGDGASLAFAIKRFQALDEVERTKLGEAGRETVFHELTPERIASLRLEAYEMVISKYQASPLPEDDWLRLACSPDTVESIASMEFLDHLPLKQLLQYSFKRTIRKMSK